MSKLAKNKIIKSVVLFALTFGAISLTMTQVITMNRYLPNVLFLIVISSVLVFSFRKAFLKVIKQIDRHYFILIIISLVVHLITSYFILHYIKQPIWPFSDRGTSFLLMNNFYIWVKPFDVLVQQLLIILLVTKLSEYKLSLRQVTTLFVIGFGIIHIFQIFKTDVIIGLSFTFGALLLSFIYPYMILRVKNGYIYNYMIHLGMYNIAAFLTWTLY